MPNEITKPEYINHLPAIAQEDVAGLLKAQESYGDSWRKRGGTGAFMMLARKWDRIELQVQRVGYDVFAAAKADQRPEGIIDDIRDLRRYLMLVEAELRVQTGVCTVKGNREDEPATTAVSCVEQGIHHLWVSTGLYITCSRCHMRKPGQS